ncbi:MAG TPA: hypothetical protein DD706_02775 [Nitrospiraceae bacterium]|nr:hypothetical protein [Nitrospiraceae bacterium]
MVEMPMIRTQLRAGYGEGRKVLIVLPFVLGAWIAGLLFGPQESPIVGNLWANAVPCHLQQPFRDGESLAGDSSGTAFIYSLQPWGGVRFDQSERTPYPRWDVYTLPRRSGEYSVSTAITPGPVAESKIGMKQALPQTVQFLRLRKQNWMTTS